MKCLLILLLLFSSALANMPLDDLIFTDLPGSRSYHISTGNGFFINNNTALTSAHVVENCLRITIRNNRRSYLARLSSVDKKLDLALLIIADQVENSELLTLTESLPAALVDQLIFVNSSSDYLKQTRITKIDNFLFEFFGDFKPGDSGSPIFDQQLNLIGLLIAKIEIFDLEKKLLFKTNQGIYVEQITKFIGNGQITMASSSKNLPKIKK